MRYIYVAFTCSLLSLVSCNSSTTPANTTFSDSANSQAKAPVLPVKSKLTDAGTQLLMAAVNNYYTLKNALVATKAGRADSAAGQLTITADSLRSLLQKDAASVIILKPYMDTIISQGKQLSAIKDETCEKQRLAFGTLSSAMFGLLKSVNLQHARIYREYCPMAFNEKGAFWLSDETEIKNPYFGKKMMECGEVTDTL